MRHTSALSIVLASGSLMASGTNPVSAWNEAAVQATFTAGEATHPQSRALAIVQLAVHDALNSIDSRYHRYAYNGDMLPGAAAEAAIAVAAHDALVAVIQVGDGHPGFGTMNQQLAAVASADAKLAADLGTISEGPAKSDGIALGRAAAAAIVELRNGDNSLPAGLVPYTPGTHPGDWQPTPNPDPANPAGVPSYLPPSQPGWGEVRLFVLRRNTQFEPNGPPRLSSRRYARDYNEIKRIGEQQSSLRTDEQSEIARFWYENAPSMWSRIGRVLADDRKLDLWDTARLLALVNVAMADGLIAGFEAKYEFNFWRPITAIRAGDIDRNEMTIADRTWASYLNTPPNPDYPSTHSVLAGAASEVLSSVLGEDGIPFTIDSGIPFPGITRSYSSLLGAAIENGDSRVYAGIHFRSSVEDGLEEGRKIGRFVFRHSLRRVDSEE
jgi:hypothetical protein